MNSAITAIPGSAGHGLPWRTRAGAGSGGFSEQIDEPPLILRREADEVRLLDGAVRGFLGGGDDEVADAAALHLGGAFTTAKASGAMREPRYARCGHFSWASCTPHLLTDSLYGIIPDNVNAECELSQVRRFVT